MHYPIVCQDETGTDRKTQRALASHTGNCMSVWGMTQLEMRFFIPSAHSLSRPLPPSSLQRELLLTTAAAPHPVCIHTLPSKPISGLRPYNYVCVFVCMCVCVRVCLCVLRCHFFKSQGVAPAPGVRCLSPECE